MVAGFESAIGRPQNYSFVNNSSVFRHWPIPSVFWRSFVESFAAKFKFVALTTIAAIRLPAQAQQFSAAKFFFEQSRFSFSFCEQRSMYVEKNSHLHQL